MLLKLHIVNYTIIHEVEIDFAKGFNIITGETGAGKSILLGALSLILGERAEAIALLNKEKKCIIEGIFAMPENKEALAAVLLEMEIEPEKEILIRREIAPNGKSRAFVNDTPVNLVQLKQISTLLVDLHQQFDTMELGEQEFQREVVDCLAKTTANLGGYKKVFKTLQDLNKEIVQLKTAQAAASKTFDYNNFLYKELEEAHLEPEMLEKMEVELKVLSNAEHIKTTLQQVNNGLAENEMPVLQQLKQAEQLLRSISGWHPQVDSLQSRLHTVIIEVNDIAAELDQTNDKISYDAERIETITDRLNTGYKLLKKHQVQTTAQLLRIKEELEQQLNELSHTGDTISEKEKAAALLSEEAQKLADVLHEKRLAVRASLEKEINTLLHQVGMPNAAVKITIEKGPLTENGCSTIAILFDANKSNKFEALRKVASGGELSRLMLCIKSLVADAMALPVLIFDEIDTGISGEAARQVGIIMSHLSKVHQVICITHQAQIAAKANTHYFVYKTIANNQISTGIKILTTEERITTIAQMLSGAKPTAAALQNAREMVGN